MLKSALSAIALPSLCGVACATTQDATSSVKTEDTPPDIVLIMTDQQSYNTISALGSTTAHTPNIDRLVRQGIAFTNTYCANPLSVPSRYALFTGQSPASVGVWGNTDKDTDAAKIKQAQEQSIGAVFQKAGYQTLYGGKVHLPYARKTSKFGGTDNYFFEYVDSDEREPLAQNMAQLIKERNSDTPMLLVVSFLNPHDICFETTEDLSTALNSGGKDALKAETVAAMRALADQAAPVTYPLLPENFDKTAGTENLKFAYKDFTTDYWRRYRFIYDHLVELVDKQIGLVIDAVEVSPHKENTIIVFTSDHGEMAGSHQLITKGVPYDECQRVPLIIAGCGVVQNQTDHSLVCNGWDLLPTLCGLAHIKAPETATGISLADRAFGKAKIPANRFLYVETTKSCGIIEEGKFKYTRFKTNGNAELLIDIKNDPLEKNNLAADPEYAAKRAELATKLADELSRRGINAF